MEKKTGSIAIPFLLTLLIALLLLGGVGLIIFGDFKKDDAPLATMSQSITMVSDEDKFNLFCVLDTGDAQQPVSYMIYRFNPVIKKQVCMALPATLLVGTDGSAQLDAVYRGQGVQAAQEAVAAALGITLDRYMLFDSAGFQRLCTIAGGVKTTVAEKIEGISPSTKLQYLSASQMESLFCYTQFPGGEVQRTSIVGSTLADMLNQMDNKRVLQSLDTSFTTLVNMIKTDVSALDFKNRRHAMSYMLDHCPASCNYVFLSTTEQGGGQALTDGAKITIQESFV